MENKEKIALAKLLFEKDRDIAMPFIEKTFGDTNVFPKSWNDLSSKDQNDYLESAQVAIDYLFKELVDKAIIELMGIQVVKNVIEQFSTLIEFCDEDKIGEFDDERNTLQKLKDAIS